jgi:tetratricopeptide (TPR) repeat protein
MLARWIVMGGLLVGEPPAESPTGLTLSVSVNVPPRPPAPGDAAPTKPVTERNNQEQPGAAPATETVRRAQAPADDVPRATLRGAMRGSANLAAWMARLASSDDDRADRLAAAALCRLVAGDIELSMSGASEAIRLAPARPWGWKIRGAACLVRGEPDPALADLSEAIRLNPGDHELFVLRGQAWVAKGDDDRALVDFDEAVRQNPDDPKPRTLRMDLHFRRSDFGRAEADATERIRRAPTDGAALVVRARARRGAGRLDHALEDLDRAVELARPPKEQGPLSLTRETTGDSSIIKVTFTTRKTFDPAPLIEALLKRGELQCHRGDLDQALSDLSEVVRLDPANGAALNLRSWCWLTREDSDRALADAEAAIRSQPDLEDAWRLRGRCHFDRSEFRAAVADLTDSLRLLPNQAETLELRAAARMELEEWEAALADLAESIRLNPRSPDPHRLHSLMLHRMGRIGPALAAAEEAVRVGPNDEFARDHFWEIRVVSHRDLRETIADLDRVLEREPRRLNAQLLRVRARALLGETNAAMAEIERVIKDHPAAADPVALKALLMVGLAKPWARNVDAAGKLAEQAWELDPDSALAWEALAAVRARQAAWDDAIRSQTRAVELSSFLEKPSRQRRLAGYREKKPFRLGEP